MRSARAMTAYFGRFPVAHARVHILQSPSARVSNGVSFGEPGARCRITVGQHATQADLDDDWELTHEMIHFGFPSVEDRHHWIEEGIATYVEPIARASGRHIDCRARMARNGGRYAARFAAAGDQGLDHTHTWGRTYWGGAMFCLMADVEIRKRTGNSKGLQDALRAINRAGGTIEADWLLERALEIGDKATDGSNANGPLWPDGFEASRGGLASFVGPTWRTTQRPRGRIRRSGALGRNPLCYLPGP